MLIGMCMILFSSLLTAFSQIMLKKASSVRYEKWWRTYVNPWVISAYAILFGTTLSTVLALKFIPLSLSSALGASAQVFVAALSRLLLNEKIGNRRLLGILAITAGIIIYSI